MSPWLILAPFLLVPAFFAYRAWAKRRRRARLLTTPLSPQQWATIDHLVPIIRRLPEALRQKLGGKINLFLDEITFRGQGGLQVTEEMRLAIAAQACLLIVNSPVWYTTLRNVLILPTVLHTQRKSQDGHLVSEHHVTMAGESWTHGPVVLAWDEALHGGLDPEDGYNLVIHEFVHQLDGLTGYTNGIPTLRKGQSYAGWEKAMLDAFHEHEERVSHGLPTLIDPYGATNHQEFFAEATVTFFERPEALRREEPELYAQLAELLALDPAEWQ